MKVYVRGYGPKKDVVKAENSFQSVENTWVEYSSDPVWKMPFQEYADFDLSQLRSMNVHVGTHYCEFTTERLPDDTFTVVCPSHPSLVPTP